MPHRGPLVEIVFDNAAGIEAGQTTIRFRDVVVGVVEKLDLTPNLKRVVVTARINKDDRALSSTPTPSSGWSAPRSPPRASPASRR